MQLRTFDATVLGIADSEEQSGKFVPPPQRFHKDVWVDEDAYNDLIVAKAQLLKEFPFWGILGLTVVLVERPDDELPTLATDGMHIFYNAKFTAKLTKGERVFAIAHELFHGLYDHAGSNSRFEHYTGINMKRLIEEGDQEKIKEGMRLKLIWNFAADFIVNGGLVEAHVGEFIKTINILYLDEYLGWAVEDVYDDLLKNPEKIPQDAECLDEHIEVEVVSDEEAAKAKEEGEDGEGNGKRFVMGESEYNKLQNDWKETMISAAAAQKEHEQREPSAAGCIPSAIQRLIDELAKPKVNWRQALRRAVQRIIHRRYSYKSPNKGLFSRGITIPGFRDSVNKLDIAIFVDTSASVSEEQLTAFISELKGMMDAFPRYKIHAHCFDGAVCEDSIVKLEKSHGQDGWDHIRKFINRISGGGGTNFSCNWDYLKEHGIKPRMIIMLTDGYPYAGDGWGDPRWAPTIFFMMGNGRSIKAPFGATIHYEDFQ
jgi:predicted metal-dependent peptidase